MNEVYGYGSEIDDAWIYYEAYQEMQNIGHDKH